MISAKKVGRPGAALIIVLLMAMLLCIISMSFVNFQVMDKRTTDDEINSLKAYMMADSGISYALCHLCRDKGWQGQDRINRPAEWVYQEGYYRYGFRVDSYYNAYDSLCPYSYMYMVRSAGVVVDTRNSRCVSKRCVRAIIQCTNDYNWTHWNPTSMVLTIFSISFGGIVLGSAMTAAMIAGVTSFEPNLRPDQCHFSYPMSHSCKAFLLRYYDENQ